MITSKTFEKLGNRIEFNGFVISRSWNDQFGLMCYIITKLNKNGSMPVRRNMSSLRGGGKTVKVNQWGTFTLVRVNQIVQ